MSRKPTFGHTRDGQAVHARTIDHHPAESGYQRFNKRVALWMANNVGTMTCFWIIEAIVLLALPSVLYSMNIIHTKMLLTGYGFYLLLTWAISTNFQAIMLPGLMVGQNLQNAAGDARAAKQFEDTEQLLDAMDVHTKGGLQDVTNAIGKVSTDMAGLAKTVRAVVAALPTPADPQRDPRKV